SVTRGRAAIPPIRPFRATPPRLLPGGPSAAAALGVSSATAGPRVRPGFERTREGRLVARAVVTGGGTGIGRACARRLAADGFDVVIVGRRLDVLTKTADELCDDIGSRRVSAEPCDLEDPKAVGSLAERLGQGPTIDVLVNNAGGVSLGSAESLEELAA